MGSFTEYKVDQKELDFWFDHINNEVFNGEVPYPHIVDIRRQSKTWGYVKQVEVNGVQVVGLFIMVHVWQLMVNGDTGNHNKHFYSWRETFKEHNLDLKRCY
jgi:hypothetical protein